MYNKQRPTLKASESGKTKIKQARMNRGWTRDDDRWLNETTEILKLSGVKGAGVSLATWRRFLEAKLRIEAETFKAFCQVLGLDWEDVVEDAANNNIDLSEAPPLTSFSGRTKELAELEQWLQERCRLIVIYGMGGIGKRALARQLVEKIANKYDYLIWRSLESAPPFQQLLTELVEFLSRGQNCEINVSQLIHYLRKQKCMLVLDAWEEITSNNSPDHNDYCDFFKRVAKESHQGCILLLSREKPRNIESLEGQYVRLQRLGALTYEEAKEILIAEGLSGTPEKLDEFSKRYSNPWILKKVAKDIHSVFAGEVSDFIMENPSVFVDNVITDFLDNQFQQLSVLGKNVIYWIAIRRNTASWHQLVKDMDGFLTSSQLFSTLNYLIQGRSLVDKNLEEIPILYTLELVILKYTTNRFVEEVFAQINQTIKTQTILGSELFISHSFMTANTDEELTQQQTRRIVKVIQDKLLFKLGSLQSVENELRKILSLLEDKGFQGYGRRNISSLLS